MPKPIEELWPPFGLNITCGPVTLSPVRDADLPELDALAHAGIHAPTEMPFSFPWTLGSTGEVRLRLMQYHWKQRAAMSPASWTLETTVRFDGCLFGQFGGDAAYFIAIGEVGDDQAGALLGERAEVRGPVGVAGVDDDVVSLAVQGFCGEAAESICGPSDQDATHD
jgi:hypothetical protein